MVKKLAEAETRRRISLLARRLGRRGALMRGSLAELYVRCGRKGCRCAEGDKHGPYLYVSIFRGRRTKSVYVPRHLEGEVRRWVENAQQAQRDIAEITSLNAELLRRAREESGKSARGAAGPALRSCAASTLRSGSATATEDGSAGGEESGEFRESGRSRR